MNFKKTADTSFKSHIEYDAGLTKNFCITVSIQKFSSIQTLVLKIQQILGSYELMATFIFDYAHSTINKIIYSFPEFAPACKK